jgi:hypothetical protein
MRTITIEIVDSNDFTVKEGERYCDRLAWEEMLCSIVELTHHKLGAVRFRMLTEPEWRQLRPSGTDFSDPDEQ